MKKSLIFKVLIPACVMTLGSAIAVGWAFSLYAEHSIRQQATKESRLAVDDFHALLSATQEVLNQKVQTALQDLASEARRSGAPALGNPITVGSEQVPDLRFGGVAQGNRVELVDAVASRSGATVTVFSRKGEDFLGISTSLKSVEGARALGLLLDPKGPASLALRQGKPFLGLVPTLGVPYLTGYEPIRSPGEPPLVP